MKIAYFDCSSGAAGNMILGAMVDAGLPIKLLKDTASALKIKSAFNIERRTGCVKLTVNAKEDIKDKSFRAIDKRIRQSKLSKTTKEKALFIFGRLAKAESKVHKAPLQKVHFHELGTADALIDIACSAAGMEYFSADEVHSSPFPIFRGSIRTSHGHLALPAPATLQLIKGLPVESVPVKEEILTPTGAAIITTLAMSYGENPIQVIEKSGSGKGSKDTPPLSNCVRFYTGEGFKACVVETTIDDMNPQSLAHLRNRLLSLDALEVSALPLRSHQGRPAFILSCQCKWSDKNAIMNAILSKTSSIGVRYYPVERKILARKMTSAVTRHGKVRIKLAFDHAGKIVNAIPEYDDCVKIARTKNLPLIKVFEMVQASLHK